MLLVWLSLFYLCGIVLGVAIAYLLIYLCDHFGWYHIIKASKHWGVIAAGVLSCLYLFFAPHMFNSSVPLNTVNDLLEGVFQVLYSLGFFGVLGCSYELGRSWFVKSYRYW